MTIGEAFEVCLAEWHIAPDYIIENWTDELLDLMLMKLVERKKREVETFEGQIHPGERKVSDDVLFRQLGNKIKVIKKKA